MYQLEILADKLKNLFEKEFAEYEIKIEYDQDEEEVVVIGNDTFIKYKDDSFFSYHMGVIDVSDEENYVSKTDDDMVDYYRGCFSAYGLVTEFDSDSYIVGFTKVMNNILTSVNDSRLARNN